MRARVVAIKTAVRDLKPGDLWSDKDGTFWNRVMSGHVRGEACIWANEMEHDSDFGDDFVYRLTIVKEGDTVERDAHTMHEGFSPFAPPGTAVGEV